MPRYVIDWTISGSWEVEAKDPDDAQAKFDKAWNSSDRPDRDAEVINDAPYPKKLD